MSTEAPVILLINSPQNSKGPGSHKIDLLENHAYKRVVDVFDQALGVSPTMSLHYDRQGASVAHSVAAFSAFTNGLRETRYSGSVYPAVEFKFMGHSIGEMASFVEAGIYDIPTIAAILESRQFITERPLGAGLKFMLAAAGLDIGKYEAFLTRIKEQFQGKVQAGIANFNTPSEGVLSVQVAENTEGIDGKSLARRLSQWGEDFRYASAERFKVIYLPIANAFHSNLMAGEEAVFIRNEEQRISGGIHRVIPGMVYSPMMPGWIETEQQVIETTKYQLTRPVNFVKAMKDTLQIPNLVAIVTADVKDITPKMVQSNMAGMADIPIFNIKDNNTLVAAIRGCQKLY